MGWIPLRLLAVFFGVLGSAVAGEPGLSAKRPIPVKGMSIDILFAQVFDPCRERVSVEKRTLGERRGGAVRMEDGSVVEVAVHLTTRDEPLVLYLDPEQRGDFSVPEPLMLRSELGTEVEEERRSAHCRCRFSPTPGEEYSAEELEYFGTLERRCEIGDPCLLDCESRRMGKEVRHGCSSLCEGAFRGAIPPARRSDRALP